jgi:hypothetical protein
VAVAREVVVGAAAEVQPATVAAAMAMVEVATAAVEMATAAAAAEAMASAAAAAEAMEVAALEAVTAAAAGHLEAVRGTSRSEAARRRCTPSRRRLCNAAHSTNHCHRRSYGSCTCTGS